MSAVVNVALPVFAIILIGVLAGRARLLGPEASGALNAFVYWIALPPLLFLAMARAPVAEVLHLPFIGTWLGGLLAVWAAGSALGRLLHGSPAPVAAMQGMAASFSNTGYMGIPLFLAAFGERGLAPATLATVLMSAVAVGVAVVALELTGRRGHGAAAAVRGAGSALATNPLVVAPLAGIAASLAGLPLPAPVVTLFELTGAAASPCALFAIGLFLAGQRLTGGGAGGEPGGGLRSRLGETAWIAALKLVVHPLATAGLALWVFDLEPFWAASAILLAALPTGALTFVVASRYGIHVERTSSAILVSTVLSVITVSALLAVYAPRFGG